MPYKNKCENKCIFISRVQFSFNILSCHWDKQTHADSWFIGLHLWNTIYRLPRKYPINIWGIRRHICIFLIFFNFHSQIHKIYYLIVYIWSIFSYKWSVFLFIHCLACVLIDIKSFINYSLIFCFSDQQQQMPISIFMIVVVSVILNYVHVWYRCNWINLFFPSYILFALMIYKNSS